MRLNVGKKKAISLFLIAFVVLSISFVRAEISKLTKEQRNLLRQARQSKTISRINDLPKPVIALCADSKGRFANPAEKWEPSDFIRDPSLPRKRMIWARNSGSYYIVHYESGGFAHGYHVLLSDFEDKTGSATIQWHGIGGRLNDFETFLTAVDENKLDDQLKYSE